MPNSAHVRRIVLAPLAFIESHTLTPDDRPRTLVPFELRALANYFAIPSVRSVEAESILATLRWVSPDARAAIPSVPNGDAVDGDRFVCADQGCGCGWVYAYAPGEPMGAAASAR